MPRKAREVKGSLQNKFGFTVLDRGHKHQWLRLSLDGVRPVTVMFSQGEIELGEILLAKICRQLRVTRPYLNGMIDCSHSSVAYREKLALDGAQQRM